MKKHLIAIKIACSLALASCGGTGGGGSSNDSGATGPVISTESFPFQSAYNARIASVATDNYRISGTCSGTATISAAAPVAATFEGSAGLSVTGTSIISYANCTPASIASTQVTYYDTNYNALGHLIASVEYGKYLTGPITLPTSVKVGDTAIYGSETIYADGTMKSITGTRVRSYVIEADTASTAIVNFITQSYDSHPWLFLTQQSRFRIDTLGTLTSLSIDWQQSTLGSGHEIYTHI